jgi:hypothetical protein
VKLHDYTFAVFVALVIAFIDPAALHADTIYYRQAGVDGIQTATGTIVRETDGVVEIATADGRTVSIDRDDVFEIVRDSSSADGRSEPAGGLEDFPAASAVARGESYDGTGSGSGTVYHWGFKGGMNISNMRADPQELEEGGSLRSYVLGAWCGVPLSRHLMIQTEALFSMKGDAETAAGYTASTRLGYFELPVLARVGFLHGAPVQPSLFGGPSLAINFSARAKLEGEGSDVEVDVKDQVAAFDLGLVVGGGLDFAVGATSLGFDVRYSRGMLDVGDGANGSARNEVVTVMGSVALR